MISPGESNEGNHCSYGFDNSGDVDIYLVAGIPFPKDRTGWDGKQYWAGLVRAFTAWGWPGRLLRVGCYAADTNVDLRLHGDGEPADKDVPIKELGRRLAWRIFGNHTERGHAPAVIGHSMGGLVARAALTGVASNEPGFPPALEVAAAVTLATPHQGNRLASAEILGDHIQSRDLAFGSELVTWLQANPQPALPTCWTVIGTADDQYMDPVDTVVGMAAAGKVMYSSGQGLGHMSIHHTATGTFNLRHRAPDDPHWRDVSAGPSPLCIVWNALHATPAEKTCLKTHSLPRSVTATIKE